MKNFLTLLILSTSLSYSAQSISTSEKTESFSVGSKNAIVVNIPYGNADIVEKELKSELKDWGGKYNSSKGEQSTSQSSSKDMGDKNYDVYAKVISEKDGTVMVAFAVDLGGAYLSSREHSAQFNAMNAKIKKFAKRTAEKCIETEIDLENKVLKDLEKEQKNLVNDQESYEKSIEDYKKKISEAENKIQENKKLQETKNSEISIQSSKIGEVEKKKKNLK